MGEYVAQIVSVVDDDESLRQSLRNLLGSIGLRVETFASADAFLQSIHRHQTGCLVLDLRMPGKSGLDLLRHLSDEGSRIPVVILTATAMPRRDGDPLRRAPSPSSRSLSTAMPC
jgi:FixJ family two-component response regulator